MQRPLGGRAGRRSARKVILHEWSFSLSIATLCNVRWIRGGAFAVELRTMRVLARSFFARTLLLADFLGMWVKPVFGMGVKPSFTNNFSKHRFGLGTFCLETRECV